MFNLIAFTCSTIYFSHIATILGVKVIILCYFRKKSLPFEKSGKSQGILFGVVASTPELKALNNN